MKNLFDAGDTLFGRRFEMFRSHTLPAGKENTLPGRGYIGLTFAGMFRMIASINFPGGGESSMSRQGLGLVLTGALIWFLVSASLPAFGKEDTVRLSFQKTALSEDLCEPYTVQKGDWLLGIIQKQYGGTKQQNRKIMGAVQRLNPHMTNPDMIYPGQTLMLPSHLVEESEVREERIIDVESPDGTTTSLVYVVKEGDTLVDIIRRQLGKTFEESFRLMETVRKLNPHIADLNRIFPGQSIYIPLSEEMKARIPEPEVKEPEKPATRKFHLSPEHHIAVIEAIAHLMGGTMIREGTFYIPLPPSGQFSLDTATIPLVELKNGTTVFLDRENRIPETVARAIESIWPSYSVMKWRGDDELPALINEFVERSAGYAVEKKSAVRAVDREERVVIFIDWEVKQRVGGSETRAFAVNFINDRALLLPGNIKICARNRGYEIVEILKDQGIAGDEPSYPPQAQARLSSVTNRDLAESLLRVLGYELLRNSKIPVFSMEADGFNLSIKADLLVDEKGTAVMINFKPLPQQFVDILEQRGWRVVVVAENDTGKAVIKSVLTGLGISFIDDIFEFPLPGPTDEGGGKISITGIRTDGEGGPLFLVDYAADPHIYGLLRGRWGVNLLQY